VLTRGTEHAAGQSPLGVLGLFLLDDPPCSPGSTMAVDARRFEAAFDAATRRGNDLR